MPKDKMNMSVHLTVYDLQYWRTFIKKIGSSTDIGVFNFLFNQFKEFLGDTIELIDFKKVREVYDKGVEFELKLRSCELENKLLKEENERLKELLKEKKL